MRNKLSNNIISRPNKKGLFEIYNLALEKEKAGERIVHMEIGRPDFDTPAVIKKAAIKAIEDGNVHYTGSAGILDLRKAISRKVQETIGINYDPSNQILITVGASEALDLIWRTFLDEGDEIIIPSPYYGAYTYQLDYLGRKYITVPILKEDGTINYDRNEFIKRVTKKTKMILINSPNNPTGHVISKQELEMIADFAKEHDLIVVSDECYEHYIFEGEHKSIASLPEMCKRTLIVNSTSKTYSMTGWRVGYILGDSLYIEALTKVHAQTIICPTSFAQYGAISAFDTEIPELRVMLKKFKERRDYIIEFLKSIEGAKYVKPAGAFYIFLDVANFGIDGTDFCEKLLENKGIALCPGSNFGSEWKNYVRISYACSLEDIKYAMEKVREFIKKINCKNV